MIAKGWITVGAKRKTYGQRVSSGKYGVESIRIKALTVNKPIVADDEEAVEVELDFPDGYFDTNSPKIVVKVPAVAAAPVVTVAKVTKGRAPSAAASIVQRP